MVTGWRRSLGVPSRAVRSLAGLGALGMAVLMYLNGSALRAFGPYVAMVLFGLAGLYLLVSFLERITLGRLVVETLVLGLASAGLFVALPDVFSLGKPLYENAIHETLPAEARGYLGVARGHVAAIGRFLDTDEVPSPVEGEALIKGLDAREAFVPGFERLPPKDQGLFQGPYLRLRALDPLLENLSDRFRREIPKGPAAWLPAVLTSDVRSQLARASAELDKAEVDVARREALVESSRTTAP